MSVTLSPLFNGWQGFSIAGLPLAGGLLNTYVAGTSTPAATYTDSTGLVLNANPIVLDAAGLPPNEIWLTNGVAYKFVLTDALGLNSRSYDNINLGGVDVTIADLANASSVSKGAGMVGFDVDLAYAGATVGSQFYFRSVMEHGALRTNTNGQNKTALQAAIAAATANGGYGVIVIPPWISYGYKATDASTWPSFAGATVPLFIIDYSPGSSYSGFPTAYDGMQERIWSFTPQTTAALTFNATISVAATSATLASNWAGLTGPWQVTFSNGDVRYVTLTNGAATATWTGGLTTGASAAATYVNQGQHDGNNQYMRGVWNPGYCAHNDADYGAAGSANRTALDNRRANYSLGVDGQVSWAMMQQGTVGANETDEDMAGFSLQKFPITGDTLGAYSTFFVQRKTGNVSYGLGTLVPAAHHYFQRVTGSPSLSMMMLDSNSTTSDLVLRDSVGVADDVIVENLSGDLILRLAAAGDALTVKKTTRRVQIARSLALSKVNLTYSASMTIDSDTGNLFQIFVTNGTAFTINAPTGTLSDGQKITVRISNTAGGALGVATWNAAFKMTAWTQPANSFGRSITFYYDASTPAWIEIARNAADIPN